MARKFTTKNTKDTKKVMVIWNLMTYLMIHGISLEVKNVYKLYCAILRALRELRGEYHFMFRLVRVRDC